MEKRVAALEKYLGIDDVTEPLDKKALRLDDFVKVVEDKHYIMGDLFNKYELMEGYLKRNPTSTTTTENNDLKLNFLPQLQRRTQLISDCADDLVKYLDDLDQVQELEKYLTFDPLVDVPEKL